MALLRCSKIGLVVVVVVYFSLLEEEEEGKFVFLMISWIVYRTVVLGLYICLFVVQCQTVQPWKVFETVFALLWIWLIIILHTHTINNLLWVYWSYIWLNLVLTRCFPIQAEPPSLPLSLPPSLPPFLPKKSPAWFIKGWLKWFTI